MPQKINDTFDTLCEDFAARTGAMDLRFFKEKKVNVCAFLYRCTRIDLVYRLKDSVAAPTSVLYCRVYLNKNSELWMHLPWLMPYLNDRDFRACYFPFIESSRRMEDCFSALSGMLEEYLPAMEQLGMTGEDRKILLEYVREVGFQDMDPEKALHSGMQEQEMFLYLMGMQEPLYITRFSVLDAYEQFLLGNREKAIKCYGKMEKNGLTAYEKNLVSFLRKPESLNYAPMPEECFSQRDMKQYSGAKFDFGKGILMFGFMYLVCAVGGCLFMGAFQLISSAGTVCWLGAPWYTGLLVGGVPAVFGTIALRRWLMSIVGGKKAKRWAQYDAIINSSPATDKFAKGALVVAVLFSLVMGVFMASASVRFYDGHGDYLAEDSLFRRESFTYKDVERICRIEARYNDWDERIDRASYVLIMKDGRQLDLDGSTSLEETEEKVLPLFGDIPVEYLDSDRDLPKE